MTRVLIYTIYERIWHWVQALGILTLLVTGMVIHWPDVVTLMSFPAAVTVHNVVGFVLLINGFLGLFYYLATGSIRQYLPEPRDFISLAIAQALYYARGIFRGDPHPLEKTPEHRLNPLQQATYLIILNVLLPVQIVTGLLMWSGQVRPEALYGLGGLPVLSLIHTLGAWMFVAFVIMHIYLTTTGSTPLANIKAMIVGYEELPAHEGEAA